MTATPSETPEAHLSDERLRDAMQNAVDTLVSLDERMHDAATRKLQSVDAYGPHQKAAVSEAVDQLNDALARRTQPSAGEVVAWLIEYKNFDDRGRPGWYVEDQTGWHSWTPDANAANRFPTREAVEQFPPYRMIATDPNIAITEHVFMLAIDPNRPNAFITVPDPPSLSPATPPDQSRVERLETGWLIEINHHSVGPTWFSLTETERDGGHFTKDSIKALRFGRKEDAQAYIDDIGWTEAVPTEHEWSDGRQALRGDRS